MIKEHRHYVMDFSVIIEEFVSILLGELLSMDWKKTKSFGFNSSSLSFNQKVQLMQDIRGIDSEESKMLDYFMYIRNKFAHVFEIQHFDDLFKTSKGKEIKNLFDKKYLPTESFIKFKTNSPDSKQIYLLCFIVLCNEIMRLFHKIFTEHAINREVEQEEIEKNRSIVNRLIEAVVTIEEGKEAIQREIEKMNIQDEKAPE